MATYKLLTESNPKTRKGESQGYLSAVLHLAPHTLAGGRTVCPGSSPACRAACLNTAGRGRFDATQAARIKRTRLLQSSPKAFSILLESDLESLVRKADRLGMKPACRLNGTSDLPWCSMPYFKSIIRDFANAGVRFYDYTKVPAYLSHKSPVDYTFSVDLSSKRNVAFVRKVLGDGLRVRLAIVASGETHKVRLERTHEALEGFWHPTRSRVYVDGEQSDLRFLEPSDAIVVLKAKGPAKALEPNERSFVV